MFIKIALKDSKIMKKLFSKIQKLYIKIQPVSTFLDVTKVPDFLQKNGEVRAEGLCHVIYIFSRSFSGNV